MYGHCTIQGKKRFDEKTAKRLAKEYSTKDGLHLHAYKCPFCDAWHMTKEKRRL